MSPVRTAAILLVMTPVLAQMIFSPALAEHVRFCTAVISAAGVGDVSS
jgi:hypothetical protein